MSNEENSFDVPGWHAIGREAALIRHLIGSGAIALGRANYADRMGEYYTAFFGLSVGLERLAKLILVVDYAIKNNGRMPQEQMVRAFGHKLINLMDSIEIISTDHNLQIRYCRPTLSISTKIIECLDAFADARRGRYANFGSLDDPNLSDEEPIRKWWDVVAQAILLSHYCGKPVQSRVEANADRVGAMLSPNITLHITESGSSLRDVQSASIHTGQTEIVQKYGRYYALLTVRWLSETLSSLSRTAHGIKAFEGIKEYFQSFTAKDYLLKNRKVWPLK